MSNPTFDMRKDISIGFYCSSTSWGGLEMNTVRYAVWMKEAGYNVLLYGVEGTPFFLHSLDLQLNIKSVQRNRKYFDLFSAYRLSKQFQKDQLSLLWFRDTRDMDTLGWAKRFAFGAFKLLYQQAMQFGVSKRDVFHMMRFRPIDVWVSTLNFLSNQVKMATHVPHNRIHVVPLGVDVARLRPAEKLRVVSREAYGIGQSEYLFGIVGRIDPLKGQHTAVQALHRLHTQGHRAHLLLVGDSTLHEGDAYAVSVRNLIDDLGLRAFVHVYPYSKDVYYFYHAIDAFLMCSKGETFGTVTIEAMACGLPIIGTNSSGTPEILQEGKCGMLVEPENVEELAQAMEHCIARNSEAVAMGERARIQFHERYSKEKSMQAMIELVENTIGHENVH